jgi:hypothetical protein
LGGIALLLVFLLLTAMTAAALGAGRDVARELRMAGDALQGAQASCAADAGTAWVQAWAAEGGDGAGLLQGQPFHGDVPLAPGGGAFRQTFTVEATPLGLVPQAPEETPPRPPAHLWRLTVQGRAWAIKGGANSPVFLSRRELILAQSPGEAGGPALRVRAWRTVW